MVSFIVSPLLMVVILTLISDDIIQCVVSLASPLGGMLSRHL